MICTGNLLGLTECIKNPMILIFMQGLQRQLKGTFMSAIAGWPLHRKSWASVAPGFVMDSGTSEAAEPNVVPGIVTDPVPSKACIAKSIMRTRC
jgi:hypothetical protein